MKHRVHFCLVSNEAVPNLTPALDPEFRPAEVVLLATAKMTQRAEDLRSVLRGHGVQVGDLVPLSSHLDLELLQAEFEAAVSARDTDNIALNCTGGTKPMSIAAFIVFYSRSLPIFYVEPNDRVVWLNHPNERPAPHEIANKLRLGGLLSAYGADATLNRAPNGIDRDLRALGDALVAEAVRFEFPLGALNYAAAQALDYGGLRPVHLDRWDESPELRHIVGRFEAAGYLRQRGAQITFRDEEARQIVGGGWMEQWAFAQVFGLQRELSQIQDLAYNVQVVHRGVRNELDVAFLAENRLHVIECKTMRMDAERSRVADSITKVKGVAQRLGGFQARTMILSFRPVRPADRERAAAERVQLVEAGQIRQLASYLHRWISPSASVGA